jgi:hypothetical protein
VLQFSFLNPNSRMLSGVFFVSVTVVWAAISFYACFLTKEHLSICCIGIGKR